MAIRFYCPLGHRLVVPDERAGKKGRCPVCHQKIYVPVADPRPSGKSKLDPRAARKSKRDSTARPANPISIDDIIEQELGLGHDVLPRPTAPPPTAPPPTAPPSAPSAVPGLPLPAYVPPPAPPASLNTAPPPAYAYEPPTMPPPAPAPPAPVATVPAPPVPTPPAAGAPGTSWSQSPPSIGSILPPTSTGSPQPAPPRAPATYAIPPAALAPRPVPTSPAAPLPATTPISVTPRNVPAPRPPEPRPNAPTSLSEISPDDDWHVQAMRRRWIVRATPDVLVLADVPERRRLSAAYMLAGGLAAVALLGLAPAAQHLTRLEPPLWARAVVLVSSALLVYALWLVTVPDWSTLWLGVVLTAVAAAVYAGGMGLIVSTPHDKTPPLELGDLARLAGGWSGLNAMLLGSTSYALGRYGQSWRRGRRRGPRVR